MPSISYNIEDMQEKTHWTIWVLRVLLIGLTLGMLWFIFGNASADGVASSQQSYSVTVKVQEVVGAIAPNSPIATATGASFDLLHACIRDLAHFLEYFALALCAFGTYLSFVKEGAWRFAYISPCFVFLTVAADEYVQTLTVGRAAEFADFAVDCTGAFCGICIALMIFAIVKLATYGMRRRRA